jgi:hypothetical protein
MKYQPRSISRSARIDRDRRRVRYPQPPLLLGGEVVPAIDREFREYNLDGSRVAATCKLVARCLAEAPSPETLAIALEEEWVDGQHGFAVHIQLDTPIDEPAIDPSKISMELACEA